MKMINNFSKKICLIFLLAVGVFGYQNSEPEFCPYHQTEDWCWLIKFGIKPNSGGNDMDG